MVLAPTRFYAFSKKAWFKQQDQQYAQYKHTVYSYTEPWTSIPSHLVYCQKIEVQVLITYLLKTSCTSTRLWPELGVDRVTGRRLELAL